MNKVMEKLQQILREVFDDAQLVISRDTSAETIEEWDSITHIQLLVVVEKEFSIKFALGELRFLTNVGELADLIEKKIK